MNPNRYQFPVPGGWQTATYDIPQWLTGKIFARDREPLIPLPCVIAGRVKYATKKSSSFNNKPHISLPITVGWTSRARASTPDASRGLFINSTQLRGPNKTPLWPLHGMSNIQNFRIHTHQRGSAQLERSLRWSVLPITDNGQTTWQRISGLTWTASVWCGKPFWKVFILHRSHLNSSLNKTVALIRLV